MKDISWGIIGCGDVTEIKSGPAFNLVPDSKLIGVMRRDAAKAEDYAKRHGVKKWFSDAASLINEPDINAIYIATPPAYHEKYTLLAFEAGKSVYVEKPMAIDSTGAERMLITAGVYGCKLSVAHYRRAQPRFLKISELIRKGAIGDVHSVDLNFRQSHQPGSENTWRTNAVISGGGLFHDLAPHQLDLMIFFFGHPLDVNGQSLNRAGLYDADDYINAEILFQHNIKFKGTWDFNARREEEKDLCEIKGTSGSVRFAVFGNFCELIVNGETTSLEFDLLPHVQQPMIEQVVKYFKGEALNPCPADQGLEVMRMLDKITGKSNPLI